MARAHDDTATGLLVHAELGLGQGTAVVGAAVLEGVELARHPDDGDVKTVDLFVDAPAVLEGGGGAQ